MENQDSNPQLVIDVVSKTYLNEIRKWAKFLSIIGFIGIGLMVILSISMGFFVSNTFGGMEESPLSSGLFGIVYLLMAVLYFFPLYYMYKFSHNMKHALSNDSSENMVEAFKYLKSQFKFFGVYTIVFIAIYAIGLLTMGGALLFN